MARQLRIYTHDERSSIAAAREVLIAALERGDDITDAIRESAAAAVHDAWLRRHHPAHDIDLLAYEQLPEAEQEKDRAFVRIAEYELVRKNI